MAGENAIADKQARPDPQSRTPNAAPAPPSTAPQRSPDFPDHYRPVLSENVLIFKAGGKCIVVHPDSEEQYVLNETASYILSMCNGGRSIREIMQGLLSNFDIDEDTAQRDVRSVIRQFSLLRVVGVSY